LFCEPLSEGTILQELFQPPPLDESPGLKFKRALWLVGSAIFAGQIYQLFLIVVYETPSGTFPADYYVYSKVGGIVWYFLFVGLVIWDIREHKLLPTNLFNFDFSQLLVFSRTVIKYFGGCAIVVLSFSFLTGESELGLERQTTFMQGLSFLTTVVMAPIVEEIIFRGYLYTAMLSAFKRERERLVVNAMLFAAAHVFLAALLLGAWVPYYIFVLGYLLAKLYDRSRSILPCVALHSLNNGLVFVIDLAKANQVWI